MINLKFGLFWSGGKLSYLRYLTFVSLRKYHPDATIELYVSKNFTKDGFRWQDEEQDFQTNDCEQYVDLEDLKGLNVDVKDIDIFDKYPPNFQSDLFRWWWIKKNGGFYLDTDQIVLKSFKGLDRDCNFIYSAYVAPSCGLYTPVGVVGGTKDSEIVQWINDLLPQYIELNNYNSAGPFMLKSMIGSRKWNDKMYNTPSEMFYPVPDSCMVGVLYRANGNIGRFMDELYKSYAIHWFGGSKLSQEFNKGYTKEKAKSSLDVISCILRDRRII